MIVHGAPGFIDVRHIDADAVARALRTALAHDPPLSVVCTPTQAAATAAITRDHNTGAHGVRKVLVDQDLVFGGIQKVHVRLFAADLGKPVTLDPVLVLDTVNAVDGKPIVQPKPGAKLVLGDGAVALLEAKP